MKRSARAICTALNAILLGSLTTGCAGVITAPPAPNDKAAEIYLLYHSPHTSLAIPRESGGMVRYKYCDWRWCVQGRRHLPSGTAALLWPTQSGLGRGEHPEVNSKDDLDKLAPEGITRLYPLKADAEKARALKQRLDALFSQAEAQATHNEEFAMTFVPHARGYWLAHQSNLLIAQWLREMGFQVRSYPLLLAWRIDTVERETDDE
ncbi:hypothetical protein [Natronospira bacteriovora]|uniref:Lipoprotein n=1 Tax=Natronospira bacteriovora TaxID=3069753 RepID=A0ABU0W3N0_9GAMM|nr:hypothetical protein [Natronospira sp. AB-CW4]MDQ2068622.1 hypothetical protein [Natronospira sp. AB-CW4]